MSRFAFAAVLLVGFFAGLCGVARGDSSSGVFVVGEEIPEEVTLIASRFLDLAQPTTYTLVRSRESVTEAGSRQLLITGVDTEGQRVSFRYLPELGKTIEVSFPDESTNCVNQVEKAGYTGRPEPMATEEIVIEVATQYKDQIAWSDIELGTPKALYDEKAVWSVGWTRKHNGISYHYDFLNVMICDYSLQPIGFHIWCLSPLPQGEPPSPAAVEDSSLMDDPAILEHLIHFAKERHHRHRDDEHLWREEYLRVECEEPETKIVNPNVYYNPDSYGEAPDLTLVPTESRYAFVHICRLVSEVRGSLIRMEFWIDCETGELIGGWSYLSP